MAAKNYPWFPFDTAVWLLSQSVELMTYEQQGVYVRLLCMAWRDGSIPAGLEDLATLLHIDLDRMEAIWKRVGDQFSEIDGDPSRLVNDYQEELRAKQTKQSQVQSVKGRASAATRAAKKAAAEVQPATAVQPESNRGYFPVAVRLTSGWRSVQPDFNPLE